MSAGSFIARSRIGPPATITLAEECPVCCWCGHPISPVAETLDYPDGKVAHLRCPNSGPWKLCDHCGKPHMNCDCSNDSGFDRHREWEKRHGK